jgi:energy-coupling factor transport system ATP-binding protein
VILVEHRLDRVIQYVDRLIVIDDGSIIIDGEIDDVLINRYQELVEIGIGVPPLIRLFQELKRHGTNVNKIPLTVKEGRAEIRKIIKDISVQPNGVPNANISSGNIAIKIKNLWYSYSNGHTAVKNVSAEVSKGEFVAVMGRNASGKTTLVKHFNRLLVPTKGNIKIDGVDTRKATIAEMARKVGFVFQNPNDHLFADTVEEEIVFTLKNLGFDDQEVKLRLDEVLERLHLNEYRKRYPRSLSGGEKQRVALASVLAPRPEILVLDEPTRGMEYRLKSELMKFLDTYRSQGNTVILITHDVEIVAEYAARVILMSEGKIIVDGEKHDVLSQALLFSPQINRLAQSYEKYGVSNKILTVSEVLDSLS